MSLIFPFGIYNAISIQAGTVFSKAALAEIQSDDCSGWFFPAATEKAIVECASRVGITIKDPRDKVIFLL